jgi:hypothetical protein
MDSTPIVGVLVAPPSEVELLYTSNSNHIRIDLLLADGVSSFVIAPHDEVNVLNESKPPAG